MGIKTWLPLVLSLVLGLGAAFLARQMLHARQTVRPVAGTGVVVAAHDLDPGTELTAADLTTIPYPAKDIPAEATTDPHKLVGRVTSAPMLKGQLAMDNMLAAPGMPAGLQALVPQGMRAVTVEVNEFSGLGGMLASGDRVDVIANIRDDKTHETAARTIVQDVAVLAVGRQLGNAAPAPNTPPPPIPASATLLVTPKQAQAIQLASQSSRPWLALRGYHDDKTADAGITSLADLRGESDQPRPVQPVVDTKPAPAPTTQPVSDPFAEAKPVAPAQRVVRLILGNDEQNLVFRDESDSSEMANTDRSPAVPQ